MSEATPAQALPARESPPQDAASAHAVPLVVDLDDSLLATDTLAESLCALARRQPLRLFEVLPHLRNGRAAFKQRLARLALPDLAGLPVHADVLDYLGEQYRSGRRLVLATAADDSIAQGIAARWPLFEAAYGSDGVHNLRGAAKRAALVSRYGERGYDYLGDSETDLPVWAAARQALLVGDRPRLHRRIAAQTPVVKTFDGHATSPWTYLRALRPHQWLKNLLVFLPVLAAHELHSGTALLHCVWTFLAFTLCASSVYLLNDLLDLEADRRHPYKCRRVLASGRLRLPAAAAMLPLLLGAAIAIAAGIDDRVLAIVVFYYAANLAYSLGLKDQPILDVLILATGYAARVAAGGIAAAVQLSAWLLAFCIFLFFSLALVKRYAELTALRARHGAAAQARGYWLEDLGVIAAQGIGSGYLAVLVLALYTTTSTMQSPTGRDPLYWLICLLLLYWISYLWLMADRGRIVEDPVVFALKDRTCRVVMIATLLIALVAT